MEIKGKVSDDKQYCIDHNEKVLRLLFNNGYDLRLYRLTYSKKIDLKSYVEIDHDWPNRDTFDDLKYRWEDENLEKCRWGIFEKISDTKHEALRTKQQLEKILRMLK